MGAGLTFSKVSQSLFPSLVRPPDCTKKRKKHLRHQAQTMRSTERGRYMVLGIHMEHSIPGRLSAAKRETYHEACNRPVNWLCPAMLYVCEEED